MLITTERLTIRDLAATDAAAFADMASDGSLVDVGFDADCRGWMPAWIAEAREFARRDDPMRDYLAYAVALKGTGEVIGSVGCSYYEDLHEVGATYFIGAQYRGHGYAAEALRAYAAYFRERYGPTRLIATIREENVPSWRTAERVGFALTGRRMYRDINDAQAVPYRFYEMRR